MILMTMIARVADGLPLAASIQEDEQVKSKIHFSQQISNFPSISVGQKYCGLPKSSQASVQDFDSYQSHQVFDRVQ